MITVPMKVAASNEAVPMTVAAADGITAEIGATYEVKAKLQDGIADPEAEAVEYTPDEGYDGFEKFLVKAMPAGSLKNRADTGVAPTLSYNQNTRLVTAEIGGSFTWSPIQNAGFIPEGAQLTHSIVGANQIEIPKDPWLYLGDEMEFVEEIYPKTSILLKNTLFNGWTPSTTAKTIVDAETLSGKAFTADFSEYEYFLRWRWSVDVAYKSGATLKLQIHRPASEMWQVICKRPSSLANISSKNFNGNACITNFTAALLSYYNSSGQLTYTWSATYGLYASVTACAFGSSTADSTTVTPKTPTWNARCSNTYMSTARAAELDQENTALIMRGELWRIRKKSAVRNMLEHCCDIYNDHLNP